MADGKEYRRCHRFVIPDGKVQYKKFGVFGLQKTFSDVHTIINISKGGLSFSCSDNLKKGKGILVRLLIPDEGHLDLCGRIRWQKSIHGSSRYSFGVLFDSFSEKKAYNNLEALDFLRKLDKQYIAAYR